MIDIKKSDSFRNMCRKHRAAQPAEFARSGRACRPRSDRHCAPFLLTIGALAAARTGWIRAPFDDRGTDGNIMVNNIPMVQWTAALAIAAAAMAPFANCGEIPSSQDVDTPLAPAYAAPDSGTEQTPVAATRDVVEGPAEAHAAGLRPNDPARRCGNVMTAWDDPCNYANRTRISVDTGIRP